MGTNAGQAEASFGCEVHVLRWQGHLLAPETHPLSSNVQICIVGPNGAGKSTLMNLVAGDLEPTLGDARRSIKLRVGRYNQHFVDALSMEDTPVEYLMRTYGHMRKQDDTELKEHDVRSMLGKFGLAGHHHHQVRLPMYNRYAHG
jgi:ATP-binding cassette, subfamily F, member 1